MCEKQEKIKQLQKELNEHLDNELKLSELYRNAMDANYNRKREQWHVLATVAVPLAITFVSSIAALVLAIVK